MDNRITLGNKKDKIIKCDMSNINSFEELKAALSNGLYADVNNNNELNTDNSGVTQIGTPLNKANLLSDNTANSLGINNNPTVDYALHQLGLHKFTNKRFVLGINIDTELNETCFIETFNAKGTLPRGFNNNDNNIFIINLVRDPSFSRQLLFDVRSPSFYSRSKFGGNWDVWYEISMLRQQ